MSGSMQQMFYGATSFNSSMANWNVSGVNNFFAMFQGATSFNQDLSTWTTTGMSGTMQRFLRSDCLQWQYHQLEHVEYHEHVAHVQWCERVQPEHRCVTTTAATTMQGMLYAAAAFNQNIGTWNVANVTNMANMLDLTAISTTNYNAILNGWGAQTVQNNVTLGAAGRTYTQPRKPAAIHLLVLELGRSPETV